MVIIHKRRYRHAIAAFWLQYKKEGKYVGRYSAIICKVCVQIWGGMLLKKFQYRIGNKHLKSAASFATLKQFQAKVLLHIWSLVFFYNVGWRWPYSTTGWHSSYIISHHYKLLSASPCAWGIKANHKVFEGRMYGCQSDEDNKMWTTYQRYQNQASAKIGCAGQCRFPKAFVYSDIFFQFADFNYQISYQIRLRFTSCIMGVL